jgi:hypothetical protein
MKLAIMQPYFLPYISYLQLLKYADIFVVFDSVQFIDKGWINRNRIMHPNAEKKWQYISYPLSGKSNFASIRDVKVNNNFNLKSNLLGKISSFKKAPFYSDVEEYIHHIDSQISGTEYISEINTIILNNLNDRLNLNCRIIEEINISYDKSKIQHSGQWAVEISKAMSANTYINPVGGRELFKQSEFDQFEIDLEFLKSQHFTYDQNQIQFEPNLSVLDALLWNGFQNTSALIASNYTIEGSNK